MLAAWPDSHAGTGPGAALERIEPPDLLLLVRQDVMAQTRVPVVVIEPEAERDRDLRDGGGRHPGLRFPGPARRAGVAARAVEDRRDRADVQEAVVLGELGAVGELDLHPAELPSGSHFPGGSLVGDAPVTAG